MYTYEELERENEHLRVNLKNIEDHYVLRIKRLEYQNTQLLNQLVMYDAITPRVIQLNVTKEECERIINK